MGLCLGLRSISGVIDWIVFVDLQVVLQELEFENVNVLCVKVLFGCLSKAFWRNV